MVYIIYHIIQYIHTRDQPFVKKKKERQPEFKFCFIRGSLYFVVNEKTIVNNI